jgi:hypothetical protein
MLDLGLVVMTFHSAASRVQMLAGFNEGWIDFELGASTSTKGTIDFETVPCTLTEQSPEE